MGGHAHDCASSVTEQNVIRDPDWNLLIVYRIGRISPGEHAGFLFRKLSPFQVAFACGALAILSNRRPLLFGNKSLDKWMLGRQHHVSRAVKCVRPSSEDADFLFLVEHEFDFRAFAATDPVSLK